MGNIIYIPSRSRCVGVICPTDMKYYFKMNDENTTVVDEIEEFNMAAVGSGIANQQTGILNECWKLSGAASSNYIRHGTTRNTDDEHEQAWTYSLWLKVVNVEQLTYFLRGYPTTTDYIQPLFSFALAEENKIYVAAGHWFNNNLMRVGASYYLEMNKWHNITMINYYDPVKDKLPTKLYLNGELDGEEDLPKSGSGTPIGRTESMALHAFVSSFNANSEYYLDNIKIWNYALNDCEVWRNYNNGNGVN